MKLKKIASLMLAGVMAVSMLAGCSDNGNTPDNGEDNNQVVTSNNAVTYANDALSASQKEVVTVTSDTTLDNWIKSIATDSSVFKADDIAKVYKTVFKADATADGVKAMRDKLVENLKDSGVIYNSDINKGFNDTPADVKSQCSSYVYAISGTLDEKSAVESAVNVIANGVDFPTELENNKYNCEYAAEISTVKVTNDSLNGESAWVIGIVITQTLDEAANVQV